MAYVLTSLLYKPLLFGVFVIATKFISWLVLCHSDNYTKPICLAHVSLLRSTVSPQIQTIPSRLLLRFNLNYDFFPGPPSQLPLFTANSYIFHVPYWKLLRYLWIYPFLQVPNLIKVVFKTSQKYPLLYSLHPQTILWQIHAAIVTTSCLQWPLSAAIK